MNHVSNWVLQISNVKISNNCNYRSSCFGSFKKYGEKTHTEKYNIYDR